MKINNKLYYFIIITTLVSLIMFIYISLNPRLRLDSMIHEILSKSTEVVIDENYLGKPENTMTTLSGGSNLMTNPYEQMFIKEYSQTSKEIDIITNYIDQKFEMSQKDLIEIKNELYTLNSSSEKIAASLKNTDKRLDNLINKVDSVLNFKRINSSLIEKIIDLNHTINLDNKAYRYTSILNFKNPNEIGIKVNERLNFNIDIYSQLLRGIEKKDTLNDSQNIKITDSINGIVTTMPMTYAVIDFAPTLGSVYKGEQSIKSDTIVISMVNKNNVLSKTFHSYSYLMPDSLLTSKSEFVLNTYVKYYDESFARFPTYGSDSVTITVYPTNSADYFFQKIQEFLIFGIDKIFYLCTTIIGLLATMILTYVRKKFNIPESEIPIN